MRGLAISHVRISPARFIYGDVLVRIAFMAIILPGAKKIPLAQGTGR